MILGWNPVILFLLDLLEIFRFLFFSPIDGMVIRRFIVTIEIGRRELYVEIELNIFLLVL